MARFPADFDESGNARHTQPGMNGEAKSGGPRPVLIAGFIMLLALGAMVAWLMLSAKLDADSKSSVSLRLQPAGGVVEDLIAPAAPKPPAPPIPIVRRVLPASVGADGRLILAPAPDPALVEQGVSGALPKIAADGAQAWHVYSHPFPPADTRPKIAIIIGGVGLSRLASELAIQRLPAAVALAIGPYGEGLQELSAKARAAGHEILLEAPMEPYDYPENDPGPYALLTSLTPDENTTRLEWLLGRFTGYIGVINFLGGKFMASEATLGPVMAELKGRGLMIIDDQSTKQSRVAELAGRIEMPFATADMQIDAVADVAQIDAKLAELEQLARARGQAAGTGLPYPITIDRVVKWAAGLEAKGIALAPVSALARIETP